MDPEFRKKQKKYHAIQDGFVHRKSPPFPLVIEIEPTTDCMLACIFCPRSSLHRPRGKISGTDFSKILENLGGPFEESMLLFSGFGEPMLHEGLASFIGLAKEAGWYCGITTNGTLLSPSSVEPLIEAGLDVLQVSLHAITEETYRRIVKGGDYGDYGDYHDVVKRIRSIIPLCKERAVFALNYTVSPLNRDETGEFSSYWREQGVSCINFSPCHNRGGFFRDPRLPLTALARAHGPGCWVFRNAVYVTWEGWLLACCNDLSGETGRGDLLQWKLEAIHEDESKSGREPSFSICRECDFPFR